MRRFCLMHNEWLKKGLKVKSIHTRLNLGVIVIKGKIAKLKRKLKELYTNTELRFRSSYILVKF